MAEHEEIHDDEVIVVMTSDDGEEYYYLEDMIMNLGEDRFAMLIALTKNAEGELEVVEDEECADLIAKIITDEDGEDVYIDPTDEEYDAVLRAYELLEEDEE